MSFKVVVTGFGPFQNHPVNASWETAKALTLLNFEDHGITIVTEKITVAYETVVNVVPALWEKHKPNLMIHLGVSGIANEVNLEMIAHKAGYKKADIDGKLPPCGESIMGEEDCISPALDMEKVCLTVNAKKDLAISTCISHNAGLYLCEFTYYASLSIDRTRTVFIHVPDIDKPYSVKQLAEGIYAIILMLVEQIKTNNPSFHNKVGDS